MRINYPRAIRESLDELLALEKRHRGERVAPRLQLWRLLKSGQVSSLRAGAPLVGYGRHQAERWWNAYKQGGMTALLSCASPPGKVSQMTPPAWQGLLQEMQAGRVASLADAQSYLQSRWYLSYTLGGVWYLFRQRGVRLKTGRRRHRKADAAAQAAFKKTSVVA